MPTQTTDRKYPIPDPSGLDAFTPGADIAKLGQAIDVDMVAALAAIKTLSEQLASSSSALRWRRLVLGSPITYTAVTYQGTRYRVSPFGTDTVYETTAQINASGITTGTDGIVKLSVAGLYRVCLDYVGANSSSTFLRDIGAARTLGTAYTTSGNQGRIDVTLPLAANTQLDVLAEYAGSSSQFASSALLTIVRLSA